MAITTIGDMFAKAKAFEDNLEKYYAAVRDSSRDNGVRLLTYYLSRHRHHFNEVATIYPPELLKHIESIELKHDVPFCTDKHFPAMNTPPAEISGGELLKAAIEYDETLAGLYKRIVEQPIIEQALEVFQTLIRIEERDIVMLKKMLAMNYF